MEDPLETLDMRIPNLHNIMAEKLPTLQGVTSSEIFKTNLDALFSAGSVFMKCETDEKFQRALRHQIRTSEEVFIPKVSK